MKVDFLDPPNVILMVERERALAARDIVALLRVKTGQDLGENPEAWIRKYGKK